jgi:hypothetical protein
MDNTMKIIYLTFLAGIALVAPLRAQTNLSEFELNDWRIRVDTLQYADSFGILRPNPDATFLVISLTVRNDRNTGETFIPQNWLKLIVAGKEFDCADLGVYLENIEPTLVKNRQAYFELPIALLNQPMSLQFKRNWFGEVYNLPIGS